MSTNFYIKCDIKIRRDNKASKSIILNKNNYNTKVVILSKKKTILKNYNNSTELLKKHFNKKFTAEKADVAFLKLKNWQLQTKLNLRHYNTHKLENLLNPVSQFLTLFTT